jgi:DHA3 family macrolide efflux protein-like MFS transporter
MKPFFIVWTGQAASLLGSSLVRFALIWWITETTGSAVMLSIAAAVAIVPNVLLSPIIGTLIDRWNRRLVMMFADGAIASATALLAILFALGLAEIEIIFGILFIRSIGDAFHRPAMIASTTLMVPERHYSRIAGLNNALRGAMGILAPPMGAIILSLMPMQTILAIDVATAILAIVPLFFIAIPQPERKHESDTKPTMMQDLVAGLRFIWVWPGLLLLIGVYAMVHLLLAPSMVLMPLLVTDHFAGGALQLAGMQSAAGVGLVLGGLVLGVWGGFKRRMITAMLALGGMGIGMLAIGLTPENSFPIAVAGMFVVGFTLSFVTSLRLAILQASVPPEMQGRVITVALNGTSATDPLGLVIAAPLAEILGVRIWYVLCGLITIAMSAGSFFSKSIMSIEVRVHDNHNEE